MMKTLAMAAALAVASPMAFAGGITVINNGCLKQESAKALACVVTRDWEVPTDAMYAANANLADYLVDGKVPPRSALGTQVSS